MAAAGLGGVTIVGRGAFNPAIVHPRWLAEKSLLPESVAEHATAETSPQQLLVTSQLAVFVADWLSVQVTQEQAVFSTVDQGREIDLRDFARGLFELLPETPMDAIGINSDTHFQTANEEAWHAFGDRFLPKDFWEPLFDGDGWVTRKGGTRVGMRSMIVEVHRDDPLQPGFVRVEVAPSVRLVPNGVYVGINGHFALNRSDDLRCTALDAAEIIKLHWSDVRALESQLVERILEAV